VSNYVGCRFLPVIYKERNDKNDRLYKALPTNLDTFPEKPEVAELDEWYTLPSKTQELMGRLTDRSAIIPGSPSAIRRTTA
jgi:hypothetical protein